MLSCEKLFLFPVFLLIGIGKDAKFAYFLLVSSWREPINWKKYIFFSKTINNQNLALEKRVH